MSCVRFSPQPEIVTYELELEEVELKKCLDINSEYRKETQLYQMVLDWKKLNPKEATHSWDNSNELTEFLGSKSRSKRAAQHLSSGNYGELVEKTAEFVFDSWPRQKVDRREYRLTVVIVLNLVAEYLCGNFHYRLSRTEEQNHLYNNIFHLTQVIVSMYF